MLHTGGHFGGLDRSFPPVVPSPILRLTKAGVPWEGAVRGRWSAPTQEDVTESLLAAFNEDGSAKETPPRIVLPDGRTAVFTSVGLSVETRGDGMKRIRSGNGTAWVFGPAGAGD